ncbi:MAG: ABC transporter substrate-binding protein, partial [Chloroflexota bacterium]
LPVGGLLSACSWVTSEPATPSPSPASTPEESPNPVTLTPDDTPTSTTDPSPTPAPPLEQVLRVSGNLAGSVLMLGESAQECVDFPSMRAGLLAVNEDFEIEPDWAESWETDDRGVSWQFRIRQNEHGWVSGAPVTADDFVSRWRTLLDPERPHPDAVLLFDIENAREVFLGEQAADELAAVAVDDWTLEVALIRPRQSFPALVASPVLTPRWVADRTETTGCDSNGPYSFSGESEGVLTLEPHSGYWSDDEATLERIEITTEGPSRAIDRFRAGETDFVRLSPADLPRVRNDHELRDWMRRGTPSQVVALIPQVDTPPFDDPNIRSALGMLIDRTRLELIVEGRVTPARRLIAEGLFPELDELGVDLDVSFDVDTALERIEGSAYPDPVSWPKLGLTIPQGDAYLERVARDLARQLVENLSIEVPVELVDVEEYQQGVRERRYPLTWIEWTYRYADPACVYADLAASFLNPLRPAVWEDEEYDDLVRLADTLEAPEERAEIYVQCEALLRGQGICIPLVHPVDYYLIQRWVRDVPQDSEGRILSSGPFHSRFTSGLEVSRRPR